MTARDDLESGRGITLTEPEIKRRLLIALAEAGIFSKVGPYINTALFLELISQGELGCFILKENSCSWEIQLGNYIS